jgi:hypothetical protein
LGTFAEVELVVRRLAAGLCERGVGAGDVIAFLLIRTRSLPCPANGIRRWVPHRKSRRVLI